MTSLPASPKKGIFGGETGEPGRMSNHLTEVLDDPYGRVYSQGTSHGSRTPGSSAGGAPDQVTTSPEVVAGPQSHGLRVVTQGQAPRFSHRDRAPGSRSRGLS